MVERPIKRSERQAKGESEQVEAKPSSGGFDRERSERRRDRSSKGGRSRDRDEERKPPASPALMRGPKPSPKKAVEEPVVEEVVVDDAAAETADEPMAEAADATTDPGETPDAPVEA